MSSNTPSNDYLPRRPSPNKPQYGSMRNINNTTTNTSSGSSSWRQPQVTTVLYDLPIGSSPVALKSSIEIGIGVNGRGGKDDLMSGSASIEGGGKGGINDLTPTNSRPGSRTRPHPPHPPRTNSASSLSSSSRPSVTDGTRRQKSQSPSAQSRLALATASNSTSTSSSANSSPSKLPSYNNARSYYNNPSGSSSDSSRPAMAQREGSSGSLGGGGGERGSMLGMGAASMYSKRGMDGVGSPAAHDLELFAHHCQLFYFSPSPPDSSATYISKTLSSLPPSHRATYTRLQSSLRAQSHDHASRLRLVQFHALISSTIPNASLSPLARGELRGKRAKRERRERLGKFLGQWCLKAGSGVGVEPFFKGLSGGLKLQGKGERSVGGAGGRRVVWEMDDAVFMEAGGKDFMNEAVTILKGILGFEDVSLTKPPKIRRPTLNLNLSSTNLLASSPMRVRDDARVEELIPLRDETSSSIATSPPPLPARKINQGPQNDQETSTSQGNRSRATSDPFLDPNSTPAGQGGGKRGPAPAPPPSRSHAPPPPGKISITDLNLRSVGSLGSPLNENSDPLSPAIVTPLLASEEAIMGPTTISKLEDAAEQVDDAMGARGRSDSDLTSSEPEDQRALIPRRSGDVLRQDSLCDDIDEDEDLSAPRMRLWTFPAHISDPEIDSLLRLFPKHITSATGAKTMRFPLPRPASLIALKAPHDVEAGMSPSRMGESEWPLQLGIRVPPEGGVGFVRPGTGRMWVGEGIREEGWRGGVWFRIGRFFRKLFGV